MLALQILRWLLLAAEVLIALPILSLCIISISAILTAKRRKNQDAATSYANFAILAEAHKMRETRMSLPSLWE